ncbi:DUF2553 family protein [Thermoactinomyces mirandus]|uniref:DUF2553 family protein n=1 Tax=Thermoactinomyces mirandus TaxID=2756294 RepID=A0A7W2ARW3_9BACL|nr:DUF2553 family protein [Thermoactinomyces mirandus]MBA4603023.1 DUF2553 family protein [Thermoactinomyces mirandus]
MSSVNITDQVQARLQNGRIVFCHNHYLIGQMNLETQQVKIRDGYTMENLYIYASAQKTPSPEQYAQNCDMDWCQ